MKTFLILISFITFGCKASSGAGPGDHFNGESAGKFVTVKESEKFDPGFYTKGCKIQGRADPVYQVDDDLKVGTNFTSFSAMKGPTKSYYMSSFETIQVVAPAYISSKLKVLDASGLGGIKRGMEFTNSCRFTIGGGEDCRLSPEPTTINLSQECRITDVAKTEFQRYYQGQFQFKNSGVTVPSQKEYTRYKVHLNCPAYKGEGWVDVINIRSNQVPSTAAHFCGGAVLYNYYGIKKKDESFLNVAVTEILDFSNP